MTSPADLVAQVDMLDTLDDAVFRREIAYEWPTIRAGIRDLAAQVEEAKRDFDTARTGARVAWDQAARLEAERDALAARLDAAEKVCRILGTSQPFGAALDAWREVAGS